MSKITGVILTYSVAEVQSRGDGFPLHHVREWLDQKGFLPLISVDAATASWHPGCGIAIGGYNHFDTADFAEFIQQLPWSCPEDVILVMHPNDGSAQVIRPTLIGR